jgi:hypothetical protein
MLKRTLCAALVALAACGPSGKPPSEPIGKQVHEDGPPPDAAPPAALTAEECGGLLDHLALLMEKGMPPEEWAAGKDELAANRDQFIKACQDGELTRASYECMLRAQDLPALKDCAP